MLFLLTAYFDCYSAYVELMSIEWCSKTNRQTVFSLCRVYLIFRFVYLKAIYSICLFFCLTGYGPAGYALFVAVYAGLEVQMHLSLS